MGIQRNNMIISQQEEQNKTKQKTNQKTKQITLLTEVIQETRFI